MYIFPYARHPHKLRPFYSLETLRMAVDRLVGQIAIACLMPSKLSLDFVPAKRTVSGFVGLQIIPPFHTWNRFDKLAFCHETSPLTNIESALYRLYTDLLIIVKNARESLKKGYET